MNIVMFTNTYLPQLGGVARSVDRFTRELRTAGHHVLVIAPQYDEQVEDDPDVYRIHAIQHFNGSDFSLVLPASFELSDRVEEFQPDLIHSHHPFLLGNTALRMAAMKELPLVFTHHTMYEHYTHYVPLELTAMKRYVARLSTGYANLCDCVIAPSQSTEEIIRARGVKSPIEVVPTGLDTDRFSSGDGRQAREELHIPEKAFVLGHVSRLAPEKNEMFLIRSVVRAMKKHPFVWLLVIGSGPSREKLQEVLSEQGLAARSRLPGPLRGQELVGAYHGMDAFVFASKTETQGMVLTEAMAAGVPVVALDAPGAREVVEDGSNGRLVMYEDEERFASALTDLIEMAPAAREEMIRHARHTAAAFDRKETTERLMNVYRRVLEDHPRDKTVEADEWEATARAVKREWDIWSNRLASLGKAIGEKQLKKGQQKPRRI
ncbi:MAG: glycosyltransferase [Phycisphaerae bacterium]